VTIRVPVVDPSDPGRLADVLAAALLAAEADWLIYEPGVRYAEDGHVTDLEAVGDTVGNRQRVVFIEQGTLRRADRSTNRLASETTWSAACAAISTSTLYSAIARWSCVRDRICPHPGSICPAVMSTLPNSRRTAEWVSATVPWASSAALAAWRTA
jgi:hypothetical protein